MKLVTTLFKAGGAGLNDVSLNKLTIHRQIKCKVRTDGIETSSVIFRAFLQPENGSKNSILN